jgi:hypothetical protein
MPDGYTQEDQQGDFMHGKAPVCDVVPRCLLAGAKEDSSAHEAAASVVTVS